MFRVLICLIIINFNTEIHFSRFYGVEGAAGNRRALVPQLFAKRLYLAINHQPGCIPCQPYAECPPGHLFRYSKNIKAVSKTVNIVEPDKETDY